MSESYSVKAILSAVDRGFSSTLGSCLGTIDKINNKISGLAFGFMSGVGTAAFNAVTGSASSLVSEINDSNASWKTFEKNMEIVEKSGGKLEKSTNEVKKELQDFAQKTIYSSSDMASTYAQLAAVGTKNTSKLVKGFGGLAAAAENPQQAMKTLSQQATQMAAKPKVAWADFKLMLEQTPAGIAAVAKHMGMSTAQMVTAVQDGEIQTEEFFDAIQKVGTNDSFTKLATEAKTVGQAMDGLKETVGNKLTPAFDVLSKIGIKAVNGVADKLSKLDASRIAKKVETFATKTKRCFVEVKKFISSTSKTVKKFRSLFARFGDINILSNGAKNAQKPWLVLKKVFDKVSGAINKVYDFVNANAGTFYNAITTGVQTAKTIWDSFKSTAEKVGGAIMDVVGYILRNSDVFMSIIASGVEAAMPYWDAFTNVLTFVIGIIKKVAQFIVENKDSIKKLIPVIFAAVAGFKGFKLILGILPFLRGFSSVLGSIAKKTAGGLASKLFGVGKAQEDVGKKSKTSGKNMLTAAKSFVLMGVAVLLIAAGFALLAYSAIQLANAGGLAIGVMVGLVLGVAAIGIGMAVLLKTLAPMGKKLTQVAIAMLAMGTAVLLVSIGFALLAQSSIALANSGGLAIGIMVGMVAAIALLAIGAAALAPALTAGAVGLIAFGAALVLVGLGAVLAAASLVIISSALPDLVEYGLQGASAIMALGSSMTMFAIGAALVSVALLALTVSMGTLVIGSVAAGIAVAAFGVAIAASALGAVAMDAALKGVNTSMKTIASNAEKTEKSLSNMQGAVNVVESGLSALGDMAKSAINSLTEAFEEAPSDVKEAGKAVGEGFATGLQAGLIKTSIVAVQSIAVVNVQLAAGRAGTYSAGSYISMGFAQGMMSQLGIIRNAAAQMAAAAEAAVRAKAKIHSPSKVADKLGAYWGEGYVGGLESMVKDAWNVAKELVSAPTVATPNLATTYGWELSGDYDYYRNNQYTIEIPVVLDGRETARVIAPYTQDELNRQQTRDSRKHGRV